MKKIRFSTRVSIFMARLLLSKLQNQFFKKYQLKLPIILVAGTAGKSSTTLLLKNLFEKNDWKVYSGASKERCLNSVTGLSMVIGDFEMDFEGSGALYQKTIFVFQAFWSYLWSKIELTEKTILIYEVGFNEQYESDHFTEIFGESVDLLVITNLTYEHSFGFSKIFDEKGYRLMQSKIPKYWQQKLESEEVESRLKNIALEQFKLLKTTQNWILPTSIGEVNNEVLHNIEGTIHVEKLSVIRSKNFSLAVEGRYAFDDQYLLPRTFAKVGYVLDIINRKYKLNDHVLQQSLANLDIPNGRFGVLDGAMGGTIVDSSYNSDPASLTGFLDMFEEVIEVYAHADFDTPEYSQRVMAPKHYLIIGEMRELGETAVDEHTAILDRLQIIGQKYGSYIQEIYLLGQEWLKCEEEAITKKDGKITYISNKKHIFKVFSRAGDINAFLTEDLIRPQSWFWIKGSQNTVFLEIVVEHLLKNKNDQTKLCRRGSEYDQIRLKWK